MEGKEFRKELEAALSGMTYPSEGDFQPLKMCEAAGLPRGRSYNYAEFIQPRLTGPHQAKQYIVLDELMRENLTDLFALVVGDRHVTIYVVGRLKGDPDLIGWVTTAVQT